MKIQKFREYFFGATEKYFQENFFRHLFIIFVNYVNVAFQQAIGRHLTPPGRGERAIWVPRPPKMKFTPSHSNLVGNN